MNVRMGRQTGKEEHAKRRREDPRQAKMNTTKDTEEEANDKQP